MRSVARAALPHDLRRGVAAAAISLLLGLLTAAPEAQAQDLDRALELYLDADFQGAVDAFEAVLAGADVDLDDAAVAQAHLASLSAVFDLGEEVVRRHVEAALALDPGAAPPAGSPSALTELFAEIATQRGGRPATLTLERGAGRSLRATLAPALRLFAGRLEIECRSHTGVQVVVASESLPEASLLLPADLVGELRCRASALNGSGVALLEDTLVILDASLDPGGDEAQAVPGIGRRYLWVWIGLVVTAVAAAVVTGVVLGTSDDNARFQPITVEGW